MSRRSTGLASEPSTRWWDTCSSLSFRSPATFGDARNDFESDLRERLEELGGGPLEQDEEVRVTSGRKRERDG